MNDDLIQFGRVPTQMITQGALLAIARKPSVLATYLAYLACANTQWESWPSEKYIVSTTGIDPDSVRRARRELEEIGLLVDTGRRNLRCKVYLIVNKPRDGAGFQDIEPRTDAGFDEDADPVRVRGKKSVTPHSRRRNPAPAPVKPRTGAGETEEQNRTEEDKQLAAVPEHVVDHGGIKPAKPNQPTRPEIVMLEEALGRSMLSNERRDFAILERSLESSPLIVDGKTISTAKAIISAVNAMPTGKKITQPIKYIARILERCRVDHQMPESPTTTPSGKEQRDYAAERLARRNEGLLSHKHEIPILEFDGKN